MSTIEAWTLQPNYSIQQSAWSPQGLSDISTSLHTQCVLSSSFLSDYKINHIRYVSGLKSGYHTFRIDLVIQAILSEVFSNQPDLTRPPTKVSLTLIEEDMRLLLFGHEHFSMTKLNTPWLLWAKLKVDFSAVITCPQAIWRQILKRDTEVL